MSSRSPQQIRLTTSARCPARSATPKSTNAGGKRPWPTLFVILANFLTPSFPILRPIPSLPSRKTRLPWSTAAFGSNATSPSGVTTTSRNQLSGMSPITSGGPTSSPMAPIVGAALSARQYAAAHRPYLRRLPLGRLQHPHQRGGRVERRLRTLPRSGKRARAASHSRQHSESGPDGLCPRQRHLHPVPFPRTPSGQSHRGQILRLACGLPRGFEPGGFLEARRPHAGRDDL